eukprot:3866232-Pleurochrysis_carterae.AAC.6
MMRTSRIHHHQLRSMHGVCSCIGAHSFLVKLAPPLKHTRRQMTCFQPDQPEMRTGSVVLDVFFS